MASLPPQSDGKALEKLPIYRSFQQSPYASLKVDSYFYTYEELLGRFRGKPIVFVEVGVLSGGSLFMWRDYFGEEARIIGIEFNPAATKWRDHGFEIFIGDQSDPAFWRTFFDEVGPVDVLLDDGGHTNEQQIVTCMQAAPHIKDGGLMIVEDVHTSYFPEFGNPSKRSFVGFAKRMIDGINGRYPRVPELQNALMDHVYSVQAYDSVIAFGIDRKRCFSSRLLDNGGKTDSPRDFRHAASWSQRVSNLERRIMKSMPLIHRVSMVKTFWTSVFRCIFFVIYAVKSFRLRKYWK